MKADTPFFTAMLYDLETGQTATIKEHDVEYWSVGNGRCDQVRGAAMGAFDAPTEDFIPTYKRFILSGVDGDVSFVELNAQYEDASLRCYLQQVEAARQPRGGLEEVDTTLQQLFRGDVVELHGVFGPDFVDQPQSGRAVVLFSHSDVNDGGNNNAYAILFPDHTRGAWYPLKNLRYLHRRASEGEIQDAKIMANEVDLE